MNAKIKRCYEILELNPGADALAVRKSYLRLVKAWHPDRLGHEHVAQKAANEKLKEINLSYEILTAYLTSVKPAPREPSTSPNRSAQQSHITKSQELFEEGLRRYRARSFKEALGLFKQAAEGGNARAQYAVGYVLHQHRQFFPLIGANKHFREILHWWRIAAENGYVDAQFMIGTFHQTGFCTSTDQAEARKWFERAASQGHAGANKWLNRPELLRKLDGTLAQYVPVLNWVLENPPGPPPI